MKRKVVSLMLVSAMVAGMLAGCGGGGAGASGARWARAFCGDDQSRAAGEGGAGGGAGAAR